MASIEIVDLHKRFGDVVALQGIDLEVQRGEIFGYLGRNGQGKSTTIRVVTGLSTPTAGTVRVEGHDVVRALDRVRAVIGVTLQEAALDPLMTGREHLVLMASLLGMPRRAARDRADELLETFGLVEAAGRRIATWSGGMQRRLDIATSLIRRPPVLFLDEPTVGLDPQNRRAMWDQIAALRAAGSTVFLTTQYLEEADALADRLAVVHGGRIVAQGTPEQLKAGAGGMEVVLEIADTATRSRLGMRLARCHSVDDRDGCLVLTVERAADVPGLLAEVHAQRVVLDHVSVTRPSLEDVFLGLTGAGVAVDTEEVA
jgi:ABC-2 type transport system ATP-binding protein